MTSPKLMGLQGEEKNENSYVDAARCVHQQNEFWHILMVKKDCYSHFSIEELC